MTLAENKNPGDSGHTADHNLIAVEVNNHETRIATIESGIIAGSGPVATQAFVTSAVATQAATDSVTYVPLASDATNSVRAGSLALNSGASTGASNTAVGHQALKVNTTGTQNAAFGMNTLATSTTGGQNVAVGYAALVAATTASANVCVGFSAGTSITTGGNNVAVGTNALNLDTTGQENVAVGTNAMHNNTTANNVVAVGVSACYSNTTGIENVGLGTSALNNNTVGQYNTAVGTQALFSNTATGNVGLGMNALYSNTSGNANVAVGYNAGYTDTPANATVTGAGCTIIGYGSGAGNATDPSAMTTLGWKTLVNANGGVAIGVDHLFNSAVANAQDDFVLGTANHTVRVPGTFTPAAGINLGTNWYLRDGTYAGGTGVGGVISYGTGAPVNASGGNGDIYLRADGGAGTTIYQRRAGAWVGIV